MRSSVTVRYIEKFLPDANQMPVPSSWTFPPQEPGPNKLVFFRSYRIRNVVSVTGNGLDKSHVCHFSNGVVEKLLDVCTVHTRTNGREREY